MPGLGVGARPHHHHPRHCGFAPGWFPWCPARGLFTSIPLVTGELRIDSSFEPLPGRGTGVGKGRGWGRPSRGPRGPQAIFLGPRAKVAFISFLRKGGGGELSPHTNLSEGGGAWVLPQRRGRESRRTVQKASSVSTCRPWAAGCARGHCPPGTSSCRVGGTRRYVLVSTKKKGEQGP